MRRVDLIDSITVYASGTSAGRKYTQTGAPKLEETLKTIPCKFFQTERGQPTPWRNALEYDAEFSCVAGSTWFTVQDNTGADVYMRVDSTLTHATGKYRVTNVKMNQDNQGKFVSASVFAQGPLE